MKYLLNERRNTYTEENVTVGFNLGENVFIKEQLSQDDGGFLLHLQPLRLRQQLRSTRSYCVRLLLVLKTSGWMT